MISSIGLFTGEAIVALSSVSGGYSEGCAADEISAVDLHCAAGMSSSRPCFHVKLVWLYVGAVHRIGDPYSTSDDCCVDRLLNLLSWDGQCQIIASKPPIAIKRLWLNAVSLRAPINSQGSSLGSQTALRLPACFFVLQHPSRSSRIIRASSHSGRSRCSWFHDLCSLTSRMAEAPVTPTAVQSPTAEGRVPLSARNSWDSFAVQS